VHFLNNVSASIGSVMRRPASTTPGHHLGPYLKDAADPQWKNDPA
jgi:hypothetical protein